MGSRQFVLTLAARDIHTAEVINFQCRIVWELYVVWKPVSATQCYFFSWYWYWYIEFISRISEWKSQNEKRLLQPFYSVAETGFHNVAPIICMCGIFGSVLSFRCIEIFKLLRLDHVCPSDVMHYNQNYNHEVRITNIFALKYSSLNTIYIKWAVIYNYATIAL